MGGALKSLSPYTRTQIITMVAVMSLLSIGLTAVGIYGKPTAHIALAKAPKLNRVFQQSTCAFEIIMSDGINGGVSLDTQWQFMGVSTVPTLITNLSSNYPNISLHFSSTNPLATNATTLLQFLMNNVSIIPNGTPRGSLNLSYLSPIQSLFPNSRISSLIPTMLGSALATNSLISQTIAAINDSISAADSIIAANSNFSAN